MNQVLLTSTTTSTLYTLGLMAAGIAATIAVYIFINKYLEKVSQIETLREKARRATESSHCYMLQRLAEIRRPLQGILGVRDIYEEEAKTSEMKDFLEVVDHCVKFVVSQLDRVQFFSEVETDKLTVEWKPTHIKELMQKVAATAEGTVFAKGAKIDVYVDEAVSSYVMADARMVQTALHEVLTNALKHINCGPVSLKVAPTARTPGEIEFTVSDCGPGIGEKELAAALNPMNSSLPPTSWKDVKGGLGLSIVRQIARKMHGRYSIKSQPSKGTTFTLAFPLPPAAPKATDLVKEPVHARSSRILVVDDEPMTRQLMRKLLERLGHSVMLAENGKEAIQLHKENNFGVIFMDLEMPEMNGLEAAVGILSLSADSKPNIIALTSHGLTEDRDACTAAGMVEFLAKPASVRQLESVLEKLGVKPLVAIEKMIELSRMYALYGEDDKLVKEAFRFAQQKLPKLQDALNAAVMAASKSDIVSLLEDLKDNFASIHCDEGINQCDALGTLAGHPDTIEFLQAMEDLNKSLHKVMGEVNSLIAEKDLSVKLAS